MSNNSSKYREDILKLKAEGRKYYEISEILGCSNSTVSYHSSKKQQVNSRINRKLTANQIKENRKRTVRRNRQYVDDILSKNSCIDCGNNDNRVLEFDHVRGKKETNISNAIRNGWSLKRLKKEISKCEIRCCNCHRIVTIERRELIKQL